MFIEVTRLTSTGYPAETIILNSDDISIIKSNPPKGCDIYLRSDQEDILKVGESLEYFRDHLIK